MARSFYNLTDGRRERPPEVNVISKLTVVRLNEPENLQGGIVPWPPPGGLPPGEDPFATPPPEDETPFLRGAEEAEREGGFKLTVERGVYLSVILHLLIILGILLWPVSPEKLANAGDQPDPLGLIKLMTPNPPEAPIPVQFFPAPGPAVNTPPKVVMPSDLNRVAHGGDPKLPKSEQPKAVAQAGIQDLSAGRGSGSGGTLAPATESIKGYESEPAAQEPNSSTPASQLTQPQRPSKLKGIPEGLLAGMTPEQVARAMNRGDGRGGDGGAGWEHEGGFADSGPLSFDTAGYEWGPYAAEMIRKIKRNWNVPALAEYGVKGKVTIRFYILKDGRVDGETILSSSGIPPFDNAAFQAIAHASPFRALPSDLGHDREGVTVTFFYNLRPEDFAPPQPPRGA